MAKYSSQRGKMLVLLQVLFRETDQNHPLSAPKLAERLRAMGVRAERKSIYEDIDVLRSKGFDVVLSRGRGYYLRERPFQLAELKLLADAVQASRFIPEEESQELIRKLARQTSNMQARALQRQVYVVGKAKSLNQMIYGTIDSIYEAINQNRQISFRYFDYGPDRTKIFRRDGARYLASPFAMIRDNDNYYLVAYDEASAHLKHYRVDKMDRIVLERAARLGREVFERLEPARYADRHFGMFQGEEQMITLSCERWTAHVMIDRFGDQVMMIPEGEGRFQAVIRAVVSPQFFGWLFGLNGGAVIVSPEPVRKEMERQLAQMLRSYQASGENKEGGHK